MNPTVRIHSLLADGGRTLKHEGHNAIALWYWLRYRDGSGSGCVSFTIPEAAVALDRSLVTVKRYLRQGQAIGLFRSVQKFRTHVEVYLGSRDNVAMRFGLSSWGMTGDVEVDRLRDLRSAATDITTAALQKSSVHLAKKGLNKRDRVNVITADVLPSSQSSAGANVLHVGNRCVFVDESAMWTKVQFYLAFLMLALLPISTGIPAPSSGGSALNIAIDIT